MHRQNDQHDDEVALRMDNAVSNGKDQKLSENLRSDTPDEILNSSLDKDKEKKLAAKPGLSVEPGATGDPETIAESAKIAELEPTAEPESAVETEPTAEDQPAREYEKETEDQPITPPEESVQTDELTQDIAAWAEPKEPFVFTDAQELSPDDIRQHRKLFVEPPEFNVRIENIKDHRVVMFSGPGGSGRRMSATEAGLRFQEQIPDAHTIYRLESLGDEYSFDIDCLMDLKNAVVVIADISKSNFAVGRLLKTLYPDQTSLAGKLGTLLKDNQVWLFLTCISNEQGATPLEQWARDAFDAQVDTSELAPDLYAVFHRFKDQELDALGAEDRERELANALADKLLEEYVSLGKEGKKLLHLGDACHVADFLHKCFISVLKGLPTKRKEWTPDRFRQVLKDKAYDFFAEQGEIKAWFDSLTPGQKCATVSVTLFDECSWPIFWELHDLVRRTLYPEVNYDESGPEKSEKLYQLEPVQAFINTSSPLTSRDDGRWADSIRAHIRIDSDTGAHIVDFVLPSFRRKMFRHLINFHRYELSRVAAALGEHATRGHYAKRWAIARALGRVGELDFTVLVIPVIKNWLDDIDDRKMTIIDLFRVILTESVNKQYQKRALNYIIKLSEGKPFPNQWTAIMLCRGIGTWDDVHLDKALSLLCTIIKQRWNIKSGTGTLTEEVLNYRIEDLFIRAIMITLQELSIHHTPVPVLEHMLHWMDDEDIKVRLFTALIAFSDETLGLPWRYVEAENSDENSFLAASKTKRFSDKFLQIVFSQREYQQLVRDIIVEILKFAEKLLIQRIAMITYERVANLISYWLEATRYEVSINSEIVVMIKGIGNRLESGKPAHRFFDKTKQKWGREGLLLNGILDESV
jgi:hypothetical protein